MLTILQGLKALEEVVAKPQRTAIIIYRHRALGFVPATAEGIVRV
jgi:hypothetical protein